MKFVVLLLALVACKDKGTTPKPQFDASIDSGIVDTMIDTVPADPCLACNANQICVQRYNGTCGMAMECADKTIECPNNTCSLACEQAYCPSPYQCQNRAPCGGESPTAFTCYGP